MTRYKIGDKVLVRGDLVVGERYAMDGESPARCAFIYEMKPFSGTIATIENILGNGPDARYLVEGSMWHWTDDMFAGLAVDLQDDAVIDIDLDELF